MSSEHISPTTQEIHAAFAEHIDGDFGARRLCNDLEAAHVPFVFWFTSLHPYYPKSSTVGQVSLLVRDLDEASRALEQRGWTGVSSEPAEDDEDDHEWEIEDDQVPTPPRRLTLATYSMDEVKTYYSTLDDPADFDFTDPDAVEELMASFREEPFTVALFPDEDWFFDVTRHCELHPVLDANKVYPTLAEHVDSLIEAYLSKERNEQDLTGLPFSLLRSLYFVKILDGGNIPTIPALHDPTFVDQLQPQNRQFHLDLLNGLPVWDDEYRNRVSGERERVRRHQPVPADVERNGAAQERSTVNGS